MKSVLAWLACIYTANIGTDSCCNCSDAQIDQDKHVVSILLERFEV